MLEEALVGFVPLDGATRIHDASIVYAAEDPVGVHIAINNLATDLEHITGKAPPTAAFGKDSGDGSSLFGSEPPKSVIIAGTVKSALIEKHINDGQLTVTEVVGRWETFKTAVVRDPFPGVESGLVIAGSDKRAVIFGIYTLTQQCGQSPYHWWADVPATRHAEIYALPKTTIHGEPTIKYRGLFINDEAPGLTGWWSRKHKVTHRPLDMEFYQHVFDLLLRLKANFLWPAMWASYTARPGNSFFVDDPGNQKLADDYGVVISTSHHEPMQRATNEFNPAQSGPWDWMTNKSAVVKFMDEGVRRAMNSESYYTLGMRGFNDHEITADDPLKVLRDVFNTERAIIKKYHGDEAAVKQLWVVYKEVATYHAAGLNPPEDVTIMFTDDNWGNVMRLPTEEERRRAGGFGLYFHLEYVGVPKSYKWQDSNHLAKIYKDLYHAYLRGIDRIWVINVGDVKPMELPFSFIMDLAWDASKIDFSTIPEYLKLFAKREFSGECIDEIAPILFERNRLVGRRKLESIAPPTYSVLNYHESERVLGEWRDLATRVVEVERRLPAELHPAYFHLVKYPIHSAFIYHKVVLGQGQNRQYAHERRNATNELAQQVLTDFEADFNLGEEYDTLLEGKWSGIVPQARYDFLLEDDDWRAPSRDVITGLSYVQLRQNYDYAFGNLGIYCEGSKSAEIQGRVCASIEPSMPTEGRLAPVLPTMDPYGPQVRTVEVFHRGDHKVPIKWSLELPYPWIMVEPNAGGLSLQQSQQRLRVSVDWAKVPKAFDDTVKIRIDYDTRPFFDLVRLPVQNRRVPEGFHGFPETAGMISIDAPNFQRLASTSSNVKFSHIPYLGTHSDSGSIALRPYLESRRAGPCNAKATAVDYDIYLFADTANLTATIYVNSTFDTDPDVPMEYALTLDDSSTPPAAKWARLVPEPPTVGGLPADWKDSVQDHVWTRKVELGGASKGKHVLTWAVNSPEIYLEKVVVDTRGGVRDSYLGPPQTTLI